MALRLLVLFLLLLVLPLPLPLLLLWLLRLLYVLLYLLFLLLRLPLFLLAGSANMDPRRSQNRPRGGGKMALEASGGLLGPRPAPSGRQGRSGAAPGRLLERSWRLLEPSWSALGASWSRLGVPGRSPEGAREALLGGIFGGLPREAEKSTMLNVFSHFLEPLLNDF